jgi:hypothetical protein
MAAPQDTQRFACKQPNSPQTVFRSSRQGRCAEIKLEEGWRNFTVQPNVIVDFHPASIVRNGESIKVWVRFHLAVPARDVQGRGWTYDGLKAAYEFKCAARQQVLVQGSYHLGSKVVYERLSNEALDEEIEPGTISDAFLRMLCGGPAVQGQDPDAAFEATFRCPENLPSREAREAELSRFLAWVRDHHPEWNTIDKITAARVALLTRHNCVKTLNNLTRP